MITPIFTAAGRARKFLARLHTDHLDSLLLHRPDPLMDPAEVGEVFDELQQSGKVLNFGVSNMNRYQMELLSSGVRQKLWADQLQMSLAHTPLIDEGINVNTQFDGGAMRTAGTLEFCRMNDVAVQTWSPLQKGFFGGVFLGDAEYSELNKVLDELAEKYGVTADAIAYAWLLRYPAKMQVVLGTTNPARVRSAAKAAEIKCRERSGMLCIKRRAISCREEDVNYGICCSDTDGFLLCVRFHTAAEKGKSQRRVAG